MSKVIRYAGFSILADGTYKFRTATDQRRIDQLIGFGEQVSMVFLDRPAASKSEAAKILLAQTDDRWIPEAQALFVKTAKDENPFAKPRKARTVKVKRSELVDDDQPLTARQRARLRAEFNERVRQAYEAN